MALKYIGEMGKAYLLTDKQAEVASRFAAGEFAAPRLNFQASYKGPSSMVMVWCGDQVVVPKNVMNALWRKGFFCPSAGLTAAGHEALAKYQVSRGLSEFAAPSASSLPAE